MLMEDTTPRPSLVIPKTNFTDYDSPVDTIDKFPLSSKYTLCNIIGYGFQGIVYETENKNIVVKKLKGYRDKKIHVLASALDISPRLYEVINKGGDTYFVYERMKSHINFKTNTKMEHIVSLCSKMLANGIFHNDLSHKNIMYDRNDNPRIIDFDSAIYYDELKLTEYDYYSNINRYLKINRNNYEIMFTNEQLLFQRNFRNYYFHAIENNCGYKYIN
jgi:tRNA A-37 threonylcarbamoyl transferase component Bud32